MKTKIHIAKIISLIFDPVIILSIFLFSLVLSVNLPLESKIFLATSLFIFFILTPLQFIILFFRNKWIDDLEITKRKQRFYIELVTLFCWSSGLFFLANAEQPILFKSFLVLILIFLFSFFINFLTKISIHIVTLTSTLMILGFSFISVFALIGLIAVPLVAWSRVVLGKHTETQVFLGVALPTSLVPLLWLILS